MWIYISIDEVFSHGKQLDVRLGITERQLFAKSRIMNEMLSPARECWNASKQL